MSHSVRVLRLPGARRQRGLRPRIARAPRSRSTARRRARRTRTTASCRRGACRRRCPGAAHARTRPSAGAPAASCSTTIGRSAVRWPPRCARGSRFCQTWPAPAPPVQLDVARRRQRDAAVDGRACRRAPQRRARAWRRRRRRSSRGRPARRGRRRARAASRRGIRRGPSCTLLSIRTCASPRQSPSTASRGGSATPTSRRRAAAARRGSAAAASSAARAASFACMRSRCQLPAATNSAIAATVDGRDDRAPRRRRAPVVAGLARLRVAIAASARLATRPHSRPGGP